MTNQTKPNPAQSPDAQPVQAATHTPGPWYVGGGPRRKAHQMRDDIEFIGIGNGACHLGNVAVTPAVSEAEAAANARLIASAPVLLAALDHALAALEHEHPDCIGEDGYSASIDDGPEMDVDLAMIRKALQLARGTK